MSDNKERVYSEEDLCEYTILQKIDELEKQLKNIKNEFNGLYETKEAADATHRLLRSNDAQINNRIDGLYNITPTDVGVKDNKLGLLHDTTWLTNQGAINLDGFTYDEATKTLKASGGGIRIMTERCYTSDGIEIPAGTYKAGQMLQIRSQNLYAKNKGKTFMIVPYLYSYDVTTSVLITYKEAYVTDDYNEFDIRYIVTFITDITLSKPKKISAIATRYYIPVE